jgi:hypothetical protein
VQILDVIFYDVTIPVAMLLIFDAMWWWVSRFQRYFILMQLLLFRGYFFEALRRLAPDVVERYDKEQRKNVASGEFWRRAAIRRAIGIGKSSGQGQQSGLRLEWGRVLAKGSNNVCDWNRKEFGRRVAIRRAIGIGKSSGKERQPDV